MRKLHATQERVTDRETAFSTSDNPGTYGSHLCLVLMLIMISLGWSGILTIADPVS